MARSDAWVRDLVKAFDKMPDPAGDFRKQVKVIESERKGAPKERGR